MSSCTMCTSTADSVRCRGSLCSNGCAGLMPCTISTAVNLSECWCRSSRSDCGGARRESRTTGSCRTHHAELLPHRHAHATTEHVVAGRFDLSEDAGVENAGRIDTAG